MVVTVLPEWGKTFCVKESQGHAVLCLSWLGALGPACWICPENNELAPFLNIAGRSSPVHRFASVWEHPGT